jgi:hypothetical protein
MGAVTVVVVVAGTLEEDELQAAAKTVSERVATSIAIFPFIDEPILD